MTARSQPVRLSITLSRTEWRLVRARLDEKLKAQCGTVVTALGAGGPECEEACDDLLSLVTLSHAVGFAAADHHTIPEPSSVLVYAFARDALDESPAVPAQDMWLDIAARSQHQVKALGPEWLEGIVALGELS